MLTQEQHQQFDRLGYLHLPNAIDAEAAAVMRDRVWQALAAKAMRPDEPQSWQQVSGSFFRKTSESDAFAAMASPAVRQALDGLFGDIPWQEPPYWGGPLYTVPNADGWEVPRGGWHLDGPSGRALDDIERIAVFACLDRVAAGGGGTVLVAGSHKVVRDWVAASGKSWPSGKLRKALQQSEPWFADLLAKEGPTDRQQTLMAPGSSKAGHPLQVVECTGHPGDVFMTHPWLLHSGAPNAAAVPRLMLLQFVNHQ